jgi:predicted PurR-regulated permease PerM
VNTIFSGADKNISGSLGSLLNISSGSSGILSSISNQFLNGATPLAFFSNALGSFGLAVAVIISSFYLSLSEDGVERFIKVVVPPDYELQALKIYSHSRRLMGSWFRTQLLSSLIMGVIVWIGLLILHVPYAFLIAFIAAVCELVPFVGPIISGAIGVVTALTISSTLALYTLIFFLIAQQFESNLLVPLLNRRSVGLHPVIVIVALLIGAEIGGFLGIVIAVPAAAVFQEVVQEWSTKKRAGNVIEEGL